MTSNTIVCRVLRPLHFHGEPYSSGQTIKATPLDAAALISSGRAELAHADDIKVVNGAIERENARVVGRIAGRAPDPWVPIGG